MDQLQSDVKTVLHQFSSEQLIDRLGDIYTKNRLVNLTNPEIELRAVVTEDISLCWNKKSYS